MNKQKVGYYICFLSIMQMSASFLHTQQHHYRTLNPMMDFALPQSLTERLHEGLIAVEGSLVNFFDQSDDAGPVLSEISYQLLALNDAYDSMIGRSNINKVYSDDREFLQKMIDRIDLMIQELERSVDLSDENGAVLQENIQLVGQLRSKLSL